MTAIAKVEVFETKLEILDPPATLVELSDLQWSDLHWRELLSTIDDGHKNQLCQRLPCHYFDYIAGSSFGGWENCIHRSVTTLITS